jgi:arginyl-tRNA synthetase
MMHDLKKAIEESVNQLFSVDVDIVLTRPEEQFGDYSTNVALQLAKQVSKNPREVAEELSFKLREELGDTISDISVAGPGFINLKLNDKNLIAGLNNILPKSLEGKIIVAEYSDPNPFKVLHAGHLYTSVVGAAIANLLELAGGEVHRVNFGGDVGLHVAKNMWAILHYLGGELPEKLAEVDQTERAEWLSQRYVEGNQAYETIESAKAEIVAINKRVYALHTDNDRTSSFAQIYWTCRQWSYDYFDEFYERIGIKFEKYYPESETAPIGLMAVKEQIGKVYEESDGAIIFDGEKYGLHSRVFINSEGLPTYEAKDVGLIIKKWQDYHFDRSVVITANEIDQYMKVVLKSIEQFRPELVEATSHLSHGMVKLAGGVKMSSRQGNIVRAVDVLNAASEANNKLTGEENDLAVLGAVKYAFLKNRIGGDIVYDPAESVSVEGNSGPYLQYSHARARSILSKSEMSASSLEGSELEPGERSLLLKITEYTETLEKAINELMPHHICTYLYELAQTFNKFYEQNRVIGAEREQLRLSLIELYADTLRDGLTLLGIASPDKM